METLLLRWFLLLLFPSRYLSPLLLLSGNDRLSGRDVAQLQMCQTHLLAVISCFSLRLWVDRKWKNFSFPGKIYFWKQFHIIFLENNEGERKESRRFSSQVENHFWSPHAIVSTFKRNFLQKICILPLNIEVGESETSVTTPFRTSHGELRLFRFESKIPPYSESELFMETRMHSSGMRTARLLTVSQHALRRGVYPSMHWAGRCVSQHALGKGLCLPRGVSDWSVCPHPIGEGGEVAVWLGRFCPGGVWPGGYLPRGVWQTPPGTRGNTPPREQNDRQV